VPATGWGTASQSLAAADSPGGASWSTLPTTHVTPGKRALRADPPFGLESHKCAHTVGICETPDGRDKRSAIARPPE